MPIAFACPSCGSQYRVRRSKAGKKTNCPKCGQRLLVPPPVQPQNKTILGHLTPAPANPSGPSSIPRQLPSQSFDVEPVSVSPATKGSGPPQMASELFNLGTSGGPLPKRPTRNRGRL